MAFSLVDSLRLRRHVHTFVAFIDMKKLYWVEATLVRLFDFGVTGPLWQLLANFLCGTVSQIRLGGSVSSPCVDSGLAQGRILSSFLFNLLIGRFAVAFRSAIPGVSLVASDSFRHACQLHADDLVVLTAFWLTFRWPSTLCMPGVFAGASPLVLAPPPWSLVLCAAALTAVHVLAAFPCPWLSSTGMWALSSLPPGAHESDSRRHGLSY